MRTPLPNIRRRDIFSLVGSSLLAPQIAWAQQTGRKIPVVGYLWHASKAEEEQPYYGAVVDEFQKLGYVSDRTIVLEHRFPAEDPERFKAMAAELVSLRPDVLMGGAVTTLYLKQATSTIPIVFMNVPDPVGLKLAESLSHPGGNSTGMVNFGRDLVGKRLQLLKEIVPGLSHVALLVNKAQSSAKIYIDEGSAVAAELGLLLEVFDVRQAEALANAFDDMKTKEMQALITASGGSLFQWKTKIASLARDHQLPFRKGNFRCRGADWLRCRPDPIVPRCGPLCGSNPQGRKSRRSSGAATHQASIARQPEGRSSDTS